MDEGVTHPWKGTIPDRKIQLRIRAALAGQPVEDGLGACRLALGPYLMERRVDIIDP